MIRWYLKYRIRRSIGQQSKLPRWIQLRTDSDRELSRYARDYAHMIQQLSSDAAAWMQDQKNLERPGWSDEVAILLQSLGGTASTAMHQPETIQPAISHSRFPNVASLRWAACLVALVLMTGGLLVMRDRANRIQARQESVQKSEMAVTATLAVWETGYLLADQSLVAWERTRDKLSRNLLDRIGDSTVSPIEDGGRWMGAAIQELQNGAIREQNSLIEMSQRFRNRFGDSKAQ